MKYVAIHYNYMVLPNKIFPAVGSSMLQIHEIL